MNINNNISHICIIIARGEVVRNFLYSDTLQVLSKNAKVTILSVINDPNFNERFSSKATRSLSLKNIKNTKLS